MKNLAAPLLAAFALLALPSVARADAASAQVSGECTYEAGVDCQASCDVSGFALQCSAMVDATCKGMLPTECQASASASCEASCSGDCEGSCNVKPPEFSCTGQCNARVEADCSAQVDTECTSQCKASATQAQCQSDCKAKLSASCKGSGNADCEGKCSGTPGTADCHTKCQASCSGSCTADVKVKCNGYLSCHADASATCEASLKGSCKGQCTSSGGALVCNGQVVSFQKTIDDAKAWLEAHGYASASSSGSCSGNMCSGKAQAEAGTKCSLPTGPGAPSGGDAGLAFGLVGLAYAASRLRKR